jgi:hypothetical protein
MDFVFHTHPQIQSSVVVTPTVVADTMVEAESDADDGDVVVDADESGADDDHMAEHCNASTCTSWTYTRPCSN